MTDNTKPTIARAGMRVCEAFHEGDDLELASRLTCREAGAIADLMRAFGEDAWAERWMRAHAVGDNEDGDCSHDLFLTLTGRRT